MALSEGDKNTCKEIGREIMKEVMEIHIASCPHGIRMGKAWMFIVGACLGSGVGGGTIVGIILKAF